MTVKFGSFNVKVEIGQAVEKIRTSLNGALHARKQKKFERSVSFKSAKIQARVAKPPRKGMSPAEISKMDEARTCIHLVARDSFDDKRWALDAWTVMDKQDPPTKQALKDALLQQQIQARPGITTL